MKRRGGTSVTIPFLDDSTAQSQRTLYGRAFEITVGMILNRLLNPQGLFIVKGTAQALSTLIDDPAIVRGIIDYNRVPVKRRCDQTQLQDYPDTDLFVLYQDNDAWRVLAIISCKVSFHARHTETCFWALLVRLSSYIKYVLVTEDGDIYRKFRSELGTSCQRPTAPRRLLESFTDRVYLLKRYDGPDDERLFKDIEKFRSLFPNKLPLYPPSIIETNPIFDDPTIPGHTQYCRGVRPFDDLVFDLLRWRIEDR
jgi:hypothetical protein